MILNQDYFDIQPNENNSEIIELKSDLFTHKKVRLFIKCDYLIHPFISGNKWRKLKYNLLFFKENSFENILTFGGAFSNHIYATAAAGKMMNIKTIGIIRGEKVKNSTLDFAQNECGMELHFINRELYKNITQQKIDKTNFLNQFKNSFILPEGGTNSLAIQGCKEIIKSEDYNQFSHICTCVGTGGTLAGIILASENKSQIIGFSSLKGIDWQKEFVPFLENTEAKNYQNWHINSDYHFGGYAKKKPELEKFIINFKTNFNIPIEFVYTGKMFFGIIDKINKSYFKENSTILAIHSGGLRNF
ncbi:MAG: pyridoxal-phosphate dependent enzyme [Cytophagales bacterium]|nr:MAG: pyridoxal-phosphate dependent enzyme [Cytophagales bacterium]